MHSKVRWLMMASYQAYKVAYESLYGTLVDLGQLYGLVIKYHDELHAYR